MTNVYFITDGEYIKIGVAKDVGKRLYSLQTGNPKELEVLKTIEVQDGEAFWKESMLHKKFLKYRAFGEWFRMGDELCEFVGCHTKVDTSLELDRIIKKQEERLAWINEQIELDCEQLAKIREELERVSKK